MMWEQRTWTRTIATVFPNATYHLFEPLAELLPEYRDNLSQLPTTIRSTLHPVGLGEKTGSTSMGIGYDPTASSALVKHKWQDFPDSAEVQIISLDDAVKTLSLPYLQLIKMDTQGFELKILKGAVETLQHVEMLLIESC